MSRAGEGDKDDALVIRRAEADDMPAVAAIFAHYVLDTVITFELQPPSVENTIYLAPEHTGQGHGRVLLMELLARARAADARQVIAVIVDTGSPASVALHRRVGFEDVGRLRNVGFKHGQWLDTVLMQCSPDDVGVEVRAEAGG